MNSTKWSSLTEFAKYLDREGICRVEDVPEKGIHIAWIDNSPEALQRRDAIRRRDALELSDEQHQQRMLEEQIRRAREARGIKRPADEAEDEDAEVDRSLRRTEGEKLSIAFGAKRKSADEEVKNGRNGREGGGGERGEGDSKCRALALPWLSSSSSWCCCWHSAESAGSLGSQARTFSTVATAHSGAWT